MAQRPPMGCSVPAMVERYLGSEYDTVKLVADNITAIVQMAATLNAGSYFQLPVGTTAERPVNPENGMVRFNEDVSRFEGYNNGWGAIGGGDAKDNLAAVTFATTVPDAANSTPWFVNLATGKTYFAVQGENASYWVEQNSHGEL